MEKAKNPFCHLRHKNGLKIISGLRGSGKVDYLLGLRDILLSEGVAPTRILYLDAESPDIRRLMTCEQILSHVRASLCDDGISYILIREAASLADAEITLGTLAAASRYDIYLTLSSRQILFGGLGKYLAGTQSLFELPPSGYYSISNDLAQSLWNEIFLKDVLAPQRILDVNTVSRIACFLSDHLGDPLSLRQVAAVVSPSGRLISPHTTSAYLDALANAFLVEKAIRFDLTEDAPQSTRYCYFFTNLTLRNTQFGAAPERDAERVRLNEAYIQLRREQLKVFIASGSKAVDFVTRSAIGVKTYWKVGASGLKSVSLDEIDAIRPADKINQ